MDENKLKRILGRIILDKMFAEDQTEVFEYLMDLSLTEYDIFVLINSQ